MLRNAKSFIFAFALNQYARAQNPTVTTSLIPVTVAGGAVVTLTEVASLIGQEGSTQTFEVKQFGGTMTITETLILSPTTEVIIEDVEVPGIIQNENLNCNIDADGLGHCTETLSESSSGVIIQTTLTFLSQFAPPSTAPSAAPASSSGPSPSSALPPPSPHPTPSPSPTAPTPASQPASSNTPAPVSSSPSNTFSQSTSSSPSSSLQSTTSAPPTGSGLLPPGLVSNSSVSTSTSTPGEAFTPAPTNAAAGSAWTTIDTVVLGFVACLGWLLEMM